jgi:hypothetical protein
MVMILMQRAAVIGLSVALLGSLAMGVRADEKVDVYSGNPGAVTLAAWGAGLIEADEEETYLDSPALRVETEGFYEGGRLILAKPTFLAKPENGYVSLVVKVHEPEAPEVTGGPGGVGDFGIIPGGDAMDPAMMDPGMVPAEPGGGPGFPGEEPPLDDAGMMPGGEVFIPEGGGMGPTAPPEPPAKITQLRVLLVTDKGELGSGPITVAHYPETTEDWHAITVSLADFGGSVDLAGATIESIAVFGDVEETFYLGSLTIGEEDKPLLAAIEGVVVPEGRANDDEEEDEDAAAADAAANRVTVKVDQEVTFKAAAQPDGSSAACLWDFDDLDGLQEQGFGPEAAWTFLTPGHYVVTLLVSDHADKRAVRMARMRVKVVE